MFLLHAKLGSAKFECAARAEFFLTAGLALLLLGGCSVIPKDGPSGADVRTQADVAVTDSTHLGYAVVQLTPLVLSKIINNPNQPVGFSRLARSTPRANVRVGPSDKLTLTIFEAAAGGLFIPDQAGSRPGNFVQMPSQEVDKDGNISVPYVDGPVHVVGRTLRDIQLDIEGRLRGTAAIRPQVVVTIDQRVSAVVNVLGEVYTGSQVALPVGGLRLLGVLAKAGGSKYPNYESLITLQRHGRVEYAFLSDVVKNPRENIQLIPGDDVYVSREQRAFLAMGATPAPGAIGGQNNRRLPFEVDNLTLAEAVAKVGGLDSTRAEPQSVFLLRLVPRETLAHIGVDVSRYAEGLVPTVFMVNLQGAEGLFLANNFFMRHRDIIYVSDSPSVDLTKFLVLVQTITSTARGITGMISDIKNLVNQ